MTGIVVVNTSISLDGFVAGPDHEMDWVFDNRFLPEDSSDLFDDVIATTGAILTGRNSYGVGEQSERPETQQAFGGRWSGPEFVLTHRPPAQAPGWYTFLEGDIGEAVATALEAASGRNLLVLGAGVAQQCLAADLVDEILLLVLPILLGDGIRLFGPDSGASISAPKKFATRQVSQVGDGVILRFVRPA